eukprot:jgi/Mesvir1/27378/Mv07184-RA.1
MDIVEKAWRDDIEGFILFWDFEKAFDRMCWEYLEHILTALGFGPQLMTVIMGMIKSLAWYLLIDGHKSATGASSRSLPQGDCMSPILFLLAHAGLYWLHQNDPRIRGFPTGNGKGIFQTAYVDDTTNVCISLPEVHAVMDNITTYSVATQQRCNVLKSTGLHIGKTNTLRYALPNLAVTWVKPGDHHLLHNCPIGCTPEGRLAEQRSFMYDETNHVGKLAGVLLTAGRWGAVHRMSLRGRTLIVNQLLFSKVLYYCQAHPPNDATTQLIQRLGSNFVWKQKGLISHTVHGWINREMSFMSWVHGGLGLHNIQWRLWSLYAKQVISVFMGVNTHPGCMLARETLASLSTHASGTSWQLGAGILGSTLISYKGLPWYWQRIWTGYNKLKPGRLVFPTTREEVARQPLFFNDLITDATNKPLGTLHGHNPYDGFLRASPPIVRVLDLYLGHGAAYRRLSYDELAAFRSGDHPDNVAIFIGGLSDGLLACPFVPGLAATLDEMGWSLVQPLLRSSYGGYGVGSLREDSEDLCALLRTVKPKRAILIGHSTGSQDVVYFLKHADGDVRRCVVGAVLQAPVSDREYFTSQATGVDEPDVMGSNARLALATRLIAEGRPHDLLPRTSPTAVPVTAYRYHSLVARLGDDDLFSSDFSDAELKERVGHMAAVPTLILFSMEDEYVPSFVDKAKLVGRLQAAMGGASSAFLAGANHAISDPAHIEQALAAVASFLKENVPSS